MLDNDVVYDVQVRAVNGQGTGSWTMTTNGTPRIANNAPAFPEAETGARGVDENRPRGTPVGAPFAANDPEGDTLRYTLASLDAATFQLGTGAQLLTRVRLDREAKARYSVIVNVSDRKDVNGDADDSVDASVDVTITIGNVNESGDIEGPQLTTVDENHMGSVASYTINDPDMDDIYWRLEGTDPGGGTDHGQFTLSPSPGSEVDLSFLEPPDFESPRDMDEDNRYRLRLYAWDGRIERVKSISVLVEPVPEPPEVEGPTSVELDENGETFVGSYTATDPESGAVPITLTGTDASDFTFIDGVLAFRVIPDFEGQATYSVTLLASAGGDTTFQDVPITIAPTSTSHPCSAGLPPGTTRRTRRNP